MVVTTNHRRYRAASATAKINRLVTVMVEGLCFRTGRAQLLVSLFLEETMDTTKLRVGQDVSLDAGVYGLSSKVVIL
jgi:hypothetical protein